MKSITWDLVSAGKNKVHLEVCVHSERRSHNNCRTLMRHLLKEEAHFSLARWAASAANLSNRGGWKSGPTIGMMERTKKIILKSSREMWKLC